MSGHMLSADPNLHEALATTAHLNDLGLDAYTQNGAVLVAEVAARAATAEAVTNRIRLLNDLLEQRPAVINRREEIVDELDKLIRSVTHG